MATRSPLLLKRRYLATSVPVAAVVADPLNPTDFPRFEIRWRPRFYRGYYRYFLTCTSPKFRIAQRKLLDPFFRQR